MIGNILLTGGSGLLGTYIKRYIAVTAPTHAELDITKLIRHEPYDLVIHAAAYTDVERAETDREACYAVNVNGTINLANAYAETPFVYISTEYVKNPVNFYAWSKKLGEQMVERICKKHLIIRTLFKPYPFPWEKAFTDQYTTGDYVDVITPMIIDVITKWDRRENKIIEVGTGRKTMYDLARVSKPDVGKCSVKDIKTVKIPADYQ